MRGSKIFKNSFSNMSSKVFKKIRTSILNFLKKQRLVRIHRGFTREFIISRVRRNMFIKTKSFKIHSIRFKKLVLMLLKKN